MIRGRCLERFDPSKRLPLGIRADAVRVRSFD